MSLLHLGMSQRDKVRVLPYRMTEGRGPLALGMNWPTLAAGEV